jgi:hypothetical protein
MPGTPSAANAGMASIADVKIPKNRAWRFIYGLPFFRFLKIRIAGLRYGDFLQRGAVGNRGAR